MVLHTGGSNEEELERLQFLVSPMMGKSFEQMQFMGTALMIVLSWFSTSLEVFIRHSQGVRYFSVTRLFFGYVTLSLFFLFADLNLNGGILAILVFFAGNPLVGMNNVFILAYCFMAGRRRRQMWLREQAGEVWHTRSLGISYLEDVLDFLRDSSTDTRWHNLLDRFDDWTLYRFVEPLFFLLLGLLIRSFLSPVIGQWMIVASLALGLKNQMVFAEEKKRLYDMQDAQLLARYQQERLSGRTSRDMAGIPVMPAIPLSKRLLTLMHGERNIRSTVQETMGNVSSDTSGTPETLSEVSAAMTQVSGNNENFIADDAHETHLKHEGKTS